ncbi:YlcI/YnfO family protein [Rubrivivax sp. JA1026]|uniref:YlcI/YnfO family protein n=1 Tax=Rubrivivax sp. JA1026 TaxID=2710888 RepID=UPI0013E90772|nr:YlcI/YnfO family protein [Rubrivivax sp. JA1026]
MKSAILPPVHVDSQLRSDLESVLSEGEALAGFIEASVRSAVQHRLAQRELLARADAAWAEYRSTGVSYSVDEVHAELQAKLEARRAQLRGKYRPAST